jgi:hypothetical protein
LDKHCVWTALAFARLNAGRSSDARMAMMAMTTSSSISVNPSRLRGEVLGPEVFAMRASQNIAVIAAKLIQFHAGVILQMCKPLQIEAVPLRTAEDGLR